MKKILKWFLLIIVISVVGFLFWAPKRYVVPILMYHHIDYVEDDKINWVSPDSFEVQMKYLKNNGFTVLKLDELVEAIQQNQKLPKKSVVITFDDGYSDNYKYAYPILKENQFPATIFVVSDLVGQDDFLTWDQIKEMFSYGIDIGAHSRQHAYLPELAAGQLEDEIKGSKRILEENSGSKVNYMAYPAGGFDTKVKEMVKEAGYKGACTTNRGFDRLNKDVYEFKRIRLNNHDTFDLVLWAKFSGYYNLFRRIREPHKPPTGEHTDKVRHFLPYDPN